MLKLLPLLTPLYPTHHAINIPSVVPAVLKTITTKTYKIKKLDRFQPS